MTKCTGPTTDQAAVRGPDNRRSDQDFFFAPRRCRATLAACLPRAVRVFFGRLAIVRFFFAAAAAFEMFRLAALFCRGVAIYPEFTRPAGRASIEEIVDRATVEAPEPASDCPKTWRRRLVRLFRFFRPRNFEAI